MLAKETLQSIAKILNVKPDDLENAIKADDEQKFEVPEVVPITVVNDLKKKSYEEGKKVASEIAAKELAKTLNVEVDTKDLKAVAEKFAEKKIQEAKIPIDEKVKTLQEKYQTLERQYNETREQYENRLFKTSLKHQLLGLLPDNTVLPKNDLTDLFFLKYEAVKTDDGKILLKKDGKPLEDNIGNPLPVETVVKDFAENYISTSAGGGGQGGGGFNFKKGETPKVFTKLSEFAAWAKTQGMQPNDDKALQILNQHKAENFEYDEIPDEIL